MPTVKHSYHYKLLSVINKEERKPLP